MTLKSHTHTLGFTHQNDELSRSRYFPNKNTFIIRNLFITKKKCLTNPT